MPLNDEIVDAARTAADALETHMDEDGRFTPFAPRITPEWLRLVQARRDFRSSGAAGTADLLTKAQAARQAADAMQPSNASVDQTLGAVGRLTQGLDQASSAGTSASTSPGRPWVAATGAAPAPGWLRGSLRVTVPLEAARRAAGDQSVAGARAEGDGKGAAGDPSYYQKLTNLFPAEALALYGTGVALFGGATLFVVAAALVVLLLLRIFASQPAQGGPPEWIAIMVAAVSYLLWATATDPSWLSFATTPDENVRRGAAFLGAALVVLAPLLIKAKPGSTP